MELFRRGVRELGVHGVASHALDLLLGSLDPRASVHRRLLRLPLDLLQLALNLRSFGGRLRHGALPFAVHLVQLGAESVSLGPRVADRLARLAELVVEPLHLGSLLVDLGPAVEGGVVRLSLNLGEFRLGAIRPSRRLPSAIAPLLAELRSLAPELLELGFVRAYPRAALLGGALSVVLNLPELHHRRRRLVDGSLELLRGHLLAVLEPALEVLGGGHRGAARVLCLVSLPLHVLQLAVGHVLAAPQSLLEVRGG